MCTDGSRLDHGRVHDAAHEGWTRRQFIRGVFGAAGALAVGGVPIRASAESGFLRALSEGNPDRILVLVQLAGGNDGLNTVVPFNDDLYYRARPTLALPRADVIPVTADLGLHSDLAPWESLFGDGKLSIVQNVGYQNPELSHFISTDVWLSGDDAADPSGTGWLGRFLEQDHSYDAPPAHPVALQIGSGSPLLFRAAGGSLGVNFPSPALLNRLTEEGGVYDAESVPNSRLGQELSFVRQVSNNSFAYARVIKDSFDRGSNRVSYPGNSLSQNLATIARLIRGGMASQIYHVTLGGFDTHAYQAGGHANLLRQLAGATSSFLTDLASDGLDERVLVMTFSEFGRRIRENASRGTDHGTAAPLFVLGGGVEGGLIGEAPDLVNLDGSANLVARRDFRSVYAAVLGGWFGLDSGAVTGILGGPYSSLGIFPAQSTSRTPAPDLPGAFELGRAYPNPIRSEFSLDVRSDRTTRIEVRLVDAQGRELAELHRGWLSPGPNRLELRVPGTVAAGVYFVRSVVDGRSEVRTLTVVR